MLGKALKAEKEKLKAAKLVQEQALKERNDFLKALQQFDEANNTAWELEADRFVEEMQELAGTIGKQLRPDQLVVMGLLLKS